jgi:hypothetical protein
MLIISYFDDYAFASVSHPGMAYFNTYDLLAKQQLHAYAATSDHNDWHTKPAVTKNTEMKAIFKGCNKKHYSKPTINLTITPTSE